MGKLSKVVIEFERKNKKHVFTIFHNLKEYGLDIEAAFLNWTFRTKKFTEESFCEYVMSKDPLILCMNQEAHENYLKI